jgi:hypothetical protein
LINEGEIATLTLISRYADPNSLIINALMATEPYDPVGLDHLSGALPMLDAEVVEMKIHQLILCMPSPRLFPTGTEPVSERECVGRPMVMNGFEAVAACERREGARQAPGVRTMPFAASFLA